MPSEYRLYGDLAAWWPLISPPEDYAEEASYFASLLRSGPRPVHDVLELGSGGGSNASHLRASFAMTLVDLSAEMLEVYHARLAEALRSHPSLVSAMVRVAVINLMIQPVWEGLAANRWNEGHLVKLQTTFSSLTRRVKELLPASNEFATVCPIQQQCARQLLIERPCTGKTI